MMRILISGLLLLLGGLQGFSQGTQFMFADRRPPVVINGDTLKYPWTGGFNSCIVNEIDLDGDTVLDLMIFDRVGNRITTFVNEGLAGQVSYNYAPEYISRFPALHDWVRTVDMDCDGDMDLVTYTNAGMGVWRNDFSPGIGLQFSLWTTQILSWYGGIQNPVFVSQVNMPAITDVDGDGDVDIITFANSSNYLEYHRNYAMDSLGTCNALQFYLEPYCWGYFKLSALSNIGLLNQNCRAGFASDDEEINMRNRHSGSVLTPLDQDCDGDVDLLNGDILGENLLMLFNGGTPDSAVITAQDSAFPVYDVQVQMQNLPAAYYLDVDNDGSRDMIVSPFATIGEDYDNLLFYKNTTNNCSNVFDFVQSRFLTDGTIDVGSASNVCLFDVDKDGLLDIVTGNDFYYNPDPMLAYSRLGYFRNTGSATQPAFTLVTDDWLGISSLTQYGLHPAFGDLDGDNDDDMLLGNADGSLIYYQNTAAPGQPCNFVFSQPLYQGIDIGNNSSPQIIDVNRDGKNDLLIGERNGVLNYFENTGTSASPVFTLITSTFGGVNVLPSGSIAGYSIPVLFDNGNGYELLVGCDEGTIYHYTNIDGNLGGTFTLSDTAWQGIHEPRRISITTGDIDGDNKFDLLAGCSAGGMRLYTQDAALSLTETSPSPYFDLWPNPTGGLLNVHLKDFASALNYEVLVHDISGRIVKKSIPAGEFMQLDISSLAPGMYLLEVRAGETRFARKFILR